jgi:hypothetical protein
MWLKQFHKPPVITIFIVGMLTIPKWVVVYCFNRIMGYVWIIYGQSVGYVWVIYGQSMGYVWVIYMDNVNP